MSDPKLSENDILALKKCDAAERFMTVDGELKDKTGDARAHQVEQRTPAHRRGSSQAF